MLNQTLFGHLATRFSGHPENLATEALLHIVSRSLIAKQALLTFFHQFGVLLTGDTMFSCQQACLDGSIPDLVGTDSRGRKRVIVEAKFWAGLTDNQPVGYLKSLPEDESGILLFIAPAMRLNILWTELLIRCRNADIQVGPEQQPGQAEIKLRTVGKQKVLALASWRVLLTHLVSNLNAQGDLTTLSDVLQLQGLCDRMDAEAFIPLRSEELTATTATRLLQFRRIVDDVANGLISDRTASVFSRASDSGGTFYRPLLLHGFRCYMQLSLELWGRYRSTPIWLSVADNEWKLTTTIREALAPLQRLDPPGVIEDGPKMLVPLPLLIGKELPEVVGSLMTQVRQIASLLSPYAQKVNDLPEPGL